MTSITPENLLDELRRAADVADRRGETHRTGHQGALGPARLDPRPRARPHLRHLQRHGPAARVRRPRRNAWSSTTAATRAAPGPSRWLPGTPWTSTGPIWTAALDRALGAFDVDLDASRLAGEPDQPTAAEWCTTAGWRSGANLSSTPPTSAPAAGPETWSRPFCEHLFAVPGRPRARGQQLRAPAARPAAGDHRQRRQTTVISGMVTDIAAWLAGRTPTLGSLRATAAADGVDLPELLPWPAGVPVNN